MKDKIIEVLKAYLADNDIHDIVPAVESTANPQFGDYSTNIALIAAKKLGKNPRELAEEIVKSIEQRAESIGLEKIEIAGPGFINFWISKRELSRKLSVISKIPVGLNESEGSFLRGEDSSPAAQNDKRGKGRKVVVEYSSPNIAKPFTIGHLRSTIIGDAVANLLEATGWDVYRDNHIGDWGTQFGKQIAALKYIDLETGKVEVGGDGFLEKNIRLIEKSERPVKELVDLYVKFHEAAESNPALDGIAREEFAYLEKETEKYEGHPESRRALWQKCIDWSWKEFDAIYKTLDVKFTENNGRGYGESYFEDKMAPVVKELEEKGLLKEGKEGAKIIEFAEESKMPPLMIIKKDGASLYATRDLATDKFRLGHYGDDVLVINEVGAEQSLYWEQIYATEYLLGWYKSGQRVHVKHGMYRFKEGKMSTRKGNVIWLEDVLYEAIERAMVLTQRKDDRAESSDKHVLPEETKKKVAEMVGIGALKWNDLRRDSKQDIAFDWDDILNMEGNSGPYLQYTYARTQSVLRKSEIRNPKSETISNVQNSNFEAEELVLLRTLYKFDEVVVAAAEKYSPNILANYLFELAQQFNLFYQKVPILKPVKDSSPAAQNDNIREFRLALTAATGNVVKTGLKLLGIQAPEQM